MTLDPKVVNIDETISFLARISANPAGYWPTWKFYKKHSKTIHNRYDLFDSCWTN